MPSLSRDPLAALLLSLAALPALAEGDPAKGEKVFKKCAACHTVEESAPSKAGPNLHGVVGRTSGTLEGFTFSEAMTKAGAEGHIWTAEEILKFVENPKQVIPGTKMTFAGLKKPEERADVLAFLTANSPAAGTAAEAPAN